MDKLHDKDDITLLSSRFYALINKVQGLLDELHESPPLEARGGETVEDTAGHGRKAYTIRASKDPDEKRHKALIKVIDDALEQIDNAVSTDVGKDPKRGSSHRAVFQYEKRLFSIEELRFLEQTLRAFHPATAPTKESHPDS